MSNSYFEQSPISDIQISELKLPLSGLIVLVGANSSGKTNLLRELHAAISGTERALIVAKEIRFRSVPKFDDYLAHLIQAGDIDSIHQPGGAPQYRKIGHQFGTQIGTGGQWPEHELKGWYGQFENYTAQPLSTRLLGHHFLAQIGLMQCSALFIEQRISLTAAAGLFDTHLQPPTSALQSLRLNMKAQNGLTEEIKKVFHKGAWLDLSGGTTAIRVSDNEYVPTPEDKCDPERMKTYRTIDSEGEGIRSYVAICITLLLAQRPLCLIDEPEMCLHPPQARGIGRFIGAYGGRTSGCTLVATHSSYVLRGILETNKNVSVIRLTRSGASFTAQHVPSATLGEATRKPMSRSEAILDGLFADGVVVCEADGDRLVYEATLNTLNSPGPDVRFIPVGGTGGFREAVRLYRALNVPVAIAADIDFLAKGELEDVLTVLSVKPSEIPDILIKVKTCVKAIRALKSETSPDSILLKLKKLAEFDGEWDSKKESDYRHQLKDLADTLNSLDLLKSKGVQALPRELSVEVTSLLNDLRSHGLFLVPKGELESWLEDLMKGVGKGNKSLWATEAARKIEDCGKGENDIWEYVQSIVSHVANDKSKMSRTI